MKQGNRLLMYAIPAIIVLAGLTVYQYGFVNARREMVSLGETSAARERALTKCMEMIAERPRLEERLGALKEKREAAASKIIEAQTLTLCAAALQETVKGIITGRGGSIASERVEKTERSGTFQVVSISIDVALPDTRALSDILFGIETHTPYIVVREVDTRVRNFRNPRELMVKLRLSSLGGGR
ncbi:MAG: type II secretion system protein GspM [Syntrophorhabdaceae bacterium]|nr:type II secretion system protein GspM [Syntrophorhabdaceae bacterium]